MLYVPLTRYGMIYGRELAQYRPGDRYGMVFHGMVWNGMVWMAWCSSSQGLFLFVFLLLCSGNEG